MKHDHTIQIPKQIEDLMQKVIDHPNDNFLELVKVSGLDPQKDFIGMDLSGMDMSHQDLSNFNISFSNCFGTNLTGTTIAEDVLGKIDTTKSIFSDTDLEEDGKKFLSILSWHFNEKDKKNAYTVNDWKYIHEISFRAVSIYR